LLIDCVILQSQHVFCPALLPDGGIFSSVGEKFAMVWKSPLVAARLTDDTLAAFAKGRQLDLFGGAVGDSGKSGAQRQRPCARTPKGIYDETAHRAGIAEAKADEIWDREVYAQWTRRSLSAGIAEVPDIVRTLHSLNVYNIFALGAFYCLAIENAGAVLVALKEIARELGPT
jgi:hypothetical protein